MTSEPDRLRDLLGEVGDKLGLDSPNEVGRVWTHWAEIVGSGIAAHADPTSLRGGVLRVRADSPTWATELGYLADEIRSRINKAVATDLVREVRVWIGPRPDTRPDGPSKTPASAAARPSEPRTEDPRDALERAREAWSKTLPRRSDRPAWKTPENPEKPR